MRRLHGIKKGRAPAARALILIRYPHTNSIYSYSSLRRAHIQGLLRPVLVTRPTSTTSRGDQYCLPLVTSTGSIADQYWSQSPSSESMCNYLYIRVILLSDLGASLTPKRFNDNRKIAIHILEIRLPQTAKGQISLYLLRLDLRRGRSISLPT